MKLSKKTRLEGPLGEKRFENNVLPAYGSDMPASASMTSNGSEITGRMNKSTKEVKVKLFSSISRLCKTDRPTWSSSIKDTLHAPTRERPLYNACLYTLIYALNSNTNFKKCNFPTMTEGTTNISKALNMRVYINKKFYNTEISNRKFYFAYFKILYDQLKFIPEWFNHIKSIYINTIISQNI